jgi:hypothetical protein
MFQISRVWELNYPDINGIPDIIRDIIKLGNPLKKLLSPNFASQRLTSSFMFGSIKFESLPSDLSRFYSVLSVLNQVKVASFLVSSSHYTLILSFSAVSIILKVECAIT